MSTPIQSVGHHSIREQLLTAYHSNHLGHALLFVEKPGSGALALAIELAANIIGNHDEAAKNRVLRLQHPDLHLAFPIVQNVTGKVLTSSSALGEFKDFILKNPFAGIEDWLKFQEVERKLPAINAAEIQELNYNLSVKSYTGGAKVQIIWLPEYMHPSAANKLLKGLEEPTENTYLFLISQNAGKLLPTITSRCQSIRLKILDDSVISNYLVQKYGLTHENAKTQAATVNGNLNEALALLSQEPNEFESVFVDWVRMAFMVKTKLVELESIIRWSEKVATWPRDRQLGLLSFASEIFRKALLTNYNVEKLGQYNASSSGFKFDKFSNYIHGANIVEILDEINRAAHELTQNANQRLVWLDTSLKLTRLLHRKI